MKAALLRVLKPIVQRIPFASILYRRRRDAAMLRREPAPTPMGFRFAGNEAMERGLFEPEETVLIRRLLPEFDVFINVGAHVGYYACLALQLEREVVAFEPMPANLQALLKNVKANGWERSIEVFPMALSDRTGIVEIFGSGTGASLIPGWAGVSEKHVTLVPCSTLDTILGDRFAGRRLMVLTDIEGAEKAMLEGASCLLDLQPAPVWIVEISVVEHMPQGIPINPNLMATFELFWSRGYASYTADKDLRPVTREEVGEVARTGKDTLQTHNFLFAPGGYDAGALRQAA